MSELEKNSDNTDSADDKTGLPFKEVGRERLNRRSLLGKLAVAAAVLFGIETFYAGFGFLVSKPKGEKKPVPVPKSKIKPGEPYQIIYGGKPAFVMTDEMGTIWVRCMICTHLGCIVRFIKDDTKEGGGIWHCPCHDGYFDAMGINILGPPPVPLETIPFKDKGNLIIVGGE